MNIEQLIEQIKTAPERVEFAQVIAVITAHYRYTPTRFRNGLGADIVVNEAGTNEGSCRIFAFARLNQLSEAETLACFGRYYRDDVLGNPHGSDHANIRAFIKHGWAGVEFDAGPLAS
ncbi:MAG: HopJ type III effector protein [Porticoccaceae bacterium]